MFEKTLKDENIMKSFKVKKNLSPVIFFKKNNEYIMQEEIRDRLLEISNEFIETLEYEIFIYDIILVGSLSNYNWSKYSDIDLHIVIDKNEFIDNSNESLKSLITDFLKLKKEKWNEKHTIKIKNYSVELYVQDINETSFSGGIYSILNNHWIKMPEKNDVNIDKERIFEKSDYFVNKVEQLKKSEDLAELNKLLDKIKNLRKSGLEQGGEFSYENLTFKLLRRNGTIKKIMSIKNNIINKKFSIK